MRDRFLIAFAIVVLTSTSLAARPASGPATQPVQSAKESVAVRRCVYVLDHSGSMVKKIKAARTFLHAEIDKLAPASLFNVILTNGEGCVSFKPDLCTPTNEIKTALRDFLGKATTGGTDDLINALRIAKKSDASIVLITDGVPGGGAIEHEQLAAATVH